MLEATRGGAYLGEMVRYCKEELDIASVTVVSNGSKVPGWGAPGEARDEGAGDGGLDGGVRLLPRHPRRLLRLLR